MFVLPVTFCLTYSASRLGTSARCLACDCKKGQKQKGEPLGPPFHKRHLMRLRLLLQAQ